MLEKIEEITDFVLAVLYREIDSDFTFRSSWIDHLVDNHIITNIESAMDFSTKYLNCIWIDKFIRD